MAALESALDRSAKDETEKSRMRRSIYGPPSGVEATGRTVRPQGLSSAQAASLLALVD